MLSLVIPAYNEEQCIKHAYNVIQSLLAENNIEGEFVFVDDGSTDKTYETIKELSSQKDNIVGLHFSRNFGKESAISAGLAAVSGDCAVVIDCDLQHPPEKIIEMYHLWEEGYEIVEGIKKERGQEKKMHGFAAKIFYSVISRMAGFDMANSSDFKLLDRKVIDVINKAVEGKRVDIIIGGPPCQSFSSLGRAKDENGMSLIGNVSGSSKSGTLKLAAGAEDMENTSMSSSRKKRL